MGEFSPRRIVFEIKDYVPGKNPPRPDVVKLASNENPFGPSPKALEAIIREMRNLHVYPEQKSLLLREALAQKTGLAEENVICGNGSDDIMQIIGSTYINPGDEIIITKNSFSLYELIARIFGGTPVMVDLDNQQVSLDKIGAALTDKTKIIWLTNPHNPTGTFFPKEDLTRFVNALPGHVLLVLDEAYAEFADDPTFPNGVDYVKAGKNVFVLRTFSKFYGLAGLRIGYGLATKELVAPMFKTKMPFNVSRLAQAGALAALEDREFLAATYANNAAGKKYLYAELERLGLAYKKTEANFILINLKKPADPIFLELMRLGVIVRPLTSFGFPEALRVSIGAPEQNEKFIAALASIIT